MGSVFLSSSAWISILVILLEATHSSLIPLNNCLASARIMNKYLMLLRKIENSEKPAVTVYIKNCRGWWLSSGHSSVVRALVAQSRSPGLDCQRFTSISPHNIKTCL